MDHWASLASQLSLISEFYANKIPCLKNKEDRDWGDGLTVKSTGCSSQEPRFDSQHPYATNCL